MASMYPSVIECRAPRPIEFRIHPAPPWNDEGLPSAASRPSLSGHDESAARLASDAYEAKLRMKERGQKDAAHFVEQLDSCAVQEQGPGPRTWLTDLCYEYGGSQAWYVEGRASVYVVRIDWLAGGNPSIFGTLVPIENLDEPAIEFFEWNPDGANWLKEFSVVRDRVPTLRPSLEAALDRMFEANREGVFEAIRHREVTGTFDGGPRAVTSFDDATASLFATRPHPRLHLVKGNDEGRSDCWFARLGSGWFIHLRTDWGVGYVYISDDGVRYANHSLLEEAHDAYPELWYEPLDEDLQPKLYALANQRGEEQSPEENAATEAMLIDLLRVAGRESAREWLRVRPAAGSARSSSAPPLRSELDTDLSAEEMAF